LISRGFATLKQAPTSKVCPSLCNHHMPLSPFYL
jgi:hypothetical protein